jgi:hypothetical protein
MLQIIIYMLAVYYVLKGVEILYIALASVRHDRSRLIFFAVLILLFCFIIALAFVSLSNFQVEHSRLSP